MLQMFSKSLCLETIFTEVSFYERFALAAQAGFKYVEFWSWDDKDLNKIRTLCQEYDLRISAFSGDKSFSLCDDRESDDYIAYLKESISAAQYLNCDTLVIHSDALGEGGKVVSDCAHKSDFEKYAACLKTLRRAAVLAKDAGVMLALEPLNTLYDHAGNYLYTPAETAKLILAVDSPNVKMLYDIYHMHIMVGNDCNYLSDFFDFIGYIHVADVPGRGQPGSGEINYAVVFEHLREIGYTGMVGLECYPKIPSAEAAEIFRTL